jgi:hypothetical protein
LRRFILLKIKSAWNTDYLGESEMSKLPLRSGVNVLVRIKVKNPDTYLLVVAEIEKM